MIRLSYSHLEQREILEIDGDYIEIGRSRKATVRVKDTAVSGEHCYIMRLGDKWMVVDLNSRNGTYLNGKRITKERFKPGDTLAVGRAKIVFDQEIDAGAPLIEAPREGEVRRISSTALSAEDRARLQQDAAPAARPVSVPPLPESPPPLGPERSRPTPPPEERSTGESEITGPLGPIGDF